MPSYSGVEWTFLFGAAFATAFLKRTFGGGVGIALIPVLTLVFPPRFSLGLVALFLAWSDWGMARELRGEWDRRAAFVLFPGLLAGVLGGAWVLAGLSDLWLRKVIGGLCLAFALYQITIEWRGRPVEVPPFPTWMGAGVGVLSGVTAALANSGAVLCILFMVARNYAKGTIVATTWAMFFLLNPVKIAAFWGAGVVDGGLILTSLLMFPLLWVGIRAGARSHARLPQRAFNLLVLAIASAGSLRMLMFS